MEATGPTLLRRALAVLRAKQYLVFYAIPVYALAVGASLLLSWLRARESAVDVLSRAAAPFYDAAPRPGFFAVAIVVAYLALSTWFRAGYIRSIVGRFRLRPQSGTQFFSLLGVYVVTEAVAGLSAWALSASGSATVTTIVGIVRLVLVIVLMYADYAVVITGVDPVRAIFRSWACVRANVALSLLVAVAFSLVGSVASAVLFLLLEGGWLQAAPLLVIYVVVMGVVSFVVDVVLVVAYSHAVETGRLPRAR